MGGVRRSVAIHVPVDENDFFFTGHLVGPTDDLEVEIAKKF